MRVSDALAAAKPLAVEFEHGNLNISYRPASYTVAELEKIVDEEAGEDGKRRANPNRIIEMMQQMVVSWDLNEDNGEPIDIKNTTRMREIPTSVFTTILGAVRKDQSAGEAARP